MTGLELLSKPLDTRDEAADIAEAFPNVDPEFKPYGSHILVQIRRAMRKSRGGILLQEDTRQTEQWNTQVAKVVALGPVAFKNRDTLESWPEGDWCRVGTFVRCPKYGGDRWEVPIPDSDGDQCTFVLFNDLDLKGESTGNPLAIVAFL